MNKKKIFERVRVKLGHPIRDIELKDAQLDILLEDAEDIWELFLGFSTKKAYHLKVKERWITQYVCALSKELLGRIRGKFGGTIPVNETDFKMDCESLLKESDIEKERLINLLIKN